MITWPIASTELLYHDITSFSDVTKSYIELHPFLVIPSEGVISIIISLLYQNFLSLSLILVWLSCIDHNVSMSLLVQVPRSYFATQDSCMQLWVVSHEVRREAGGSTSASAFKTITLVCWLNKLCSRLVYVASKLTIIIPLNNQRNAVYGSSYNSHGTSWSETFSQNLMVSLLYQPLFTITL